MSLLHKWRKCHFRTESRSSDIRPFSTLVFTASDTTSGTLARAFQFLAERPDVQDKLRAEILGAAHVDEDIPYDRLFELPLLDAVCKETNREHTFFPYRSRQYVF